MKSVKREVDLEIRTHWAIVREDRETGEEVGRRELGYNTIPTNGLELILDLMQGASSAHLTQTDAIIEIATSSGTENMTGSSCVSGYPDHGVQGQVVFRWEDISADTYTIDTIRMRQGSDAGTIISEKTSGFFGDSDPDKPPSENWFYELTITITDGGEANFQDEGLDRILEMMTGNESGHYDGSTSGLILRVEDSNGNAAGNKQPDSGYPTRNGTTLTYRYTVAAGNLDGEPWDQVINTGGFENYPTVGIELSRDGDANLGPKGQNEEWQYDYDFSL